jgi:hypothetical protein
MTNNINGKMFSAEAQYSALSVVRSMNEIFLLEGAQEATIAPLYTEYPQNLH